MILRMYGRLQKMPQLLLKDNGKKRYFEKISYFCLVKLKNIDKVKYYGKIIVTVLIVLFANSIQSQTAQQYMAGAKKGDPCSQMFLALCYQEGKGVAKDDSVAVYWLEKSSRQGLAESQVILGNCYREGKGVEKDSVKAFELYEQASWCGASLGLDAMGDSYYYGIGVERDVIRARHYYALAAKKGYKKSKMKYDRIRFAKDDDAVIEF